MSFMSGKCRSHHISLRGFDYLPIFLRRISSTTHSFSLATYNQYLIHFRESGSFFSPWIRIRLFTLIRIRIPILIKVMPICDHWSTDPPWLHFTPHASVVSIQGPPWLHFDPAFYSEAYTDQDPASQKDAALYGSGSGSAPQLFSFSTI